MPFSAEREGGAFFDMDHTVLRGSSSLLYLRGLWQYGNLPKRNWIGIFYHCALYATGALDFPRLMGRVMPLAAPAGEDEAWKQGRAWLSAILELHIAPGARAKVAEHRAKGHEVVIVSAATRYAVKPVAHLLGLGESYLATRLEIENGCFTGRVMEPACHGRGKLAAAQRYAEEHALDLSRSYFYSDSHEDLPLLEAVGYPVVVHPTRRLAGVAAERGWAEERFY